MKGVSCQDLGENLFLFTFHQVGGKKKAVEGGPWMFEKDLIILEEFDPEKTLEEYAFSHIPIWIRVYNLPLGRMKRKTGEQIGDEIGEFLEMDGVENGEAVGKCLRIKIKFEVAKPLRRGVLIEVDDKGRKLWCPLEYEFLLDFCFIYGILGHVDKDCDKKLKRGEEPQYGKWLKWVPPRKNFSSDGYRRNLSERGGRRSYNLGLAGSRLGSDAPSWRKDASGGSGNFSRSSGEGEKEVTSPLKITCDDQGRTSCEGRESATQGQEANQQVKKTLEFSKEGRADVQTKEQGSAGEVEGEVGEGRVKEGEAIEGDTMLVDERVTDTCQNAGDLKKGGLWKVS
jgi:hypothetical protein